MSKEILQLVVMLMYIKEFRIQHNSEYEDA